MLFQASGVMLTKAELVQERAIKLEVFDGKFSTVFFEPIVYGT